MRFTLLLVCSVRARVLQTAAGYFFDNAWTCGYKNIQPVVSIVSGLTLQVCFNIRGLFE